MTYETVMQELQAKANPDSVAGINHFGIRPQNTIYGIPVPVLREMAKAHRRDHALAAQLWNSGVHEARLLATMIDDPKHVTPEQMETWAQSFDSWDICDQACANVFKKTPHAATKAVEWSAAEAEFVKRAGFTLMASLVVGDKKTSDDAFIPYFAIIERESDDARNFVKKAVNWALRQIGKRNARLNALAIECAERIAVHDSKAARWIAADALRELRSPAVQQKLAKPD